MLDYSQLDVKIPSDPDEAMRVQGQILEWVRERGYAPADQFAVRLALEEGLLNAIRHGNRLDPAKSVRVHCRIDEQTIYAEIEDEGTGFDPDRVPDPLADENLDKPSGRGLFLMRQYMNRVEHQSSGRLLILQKQRST